MSVVAALAVCSTRGHRALGADQGRCATRCSADRPGGRSGAAGRWRCRRAPLRFFTVPGSWSSAVCSAGSWASVADAGEGVVGLVDHALEVDLAQVVDDLARLRRGLLEHRRNGGDLGRIGRLLSDVVGRRVGKEVELDEEQAGEHALRLELGAHAAVDQLLARLGIGKWRPCRSVMILLGSIRT